jgi:hypothetical protein
MLIYSGCDLEHWREEFKGKDCGQVFLHYNKASSKTAKENYLDKRPLLGVPAWFKGTAVDKIKKIVYTLGLQGDDPPQIPSALNLLKSFTI